TCARSHRAEFVHQGAVLQEIGRSGEICYYVLFWGGGIERIDSEVIVECMILEENVDHVFYGGFRAIGTCMDRRRSCGHQKHEYYRKRTAVATSGAHERACNHGDCSHSFNTKYEA